MGEEKHFLRWQKRNKDKKWMTLDVKKIQIIITLMLTLILFIRIHQSLLFGNEEKLVTLLVYSSFVRVPTSGFRIFPYLLVMVVVCAETRSDSGIITILLQHGKVRIVLVTSPD